MRTIPCCVLIASTCLAGMPACRDGRLEGELKTEYSRVICGDLWMAPNQTAVVMTAVEATSPQQPFFLVWQSSRPAQINKIRVPEMETGVGLNRIFRFPQLSPNGKLLYFETPIAVTGSLLFSITLDDRRRVVSVADEVEYCVVWGGRYSGRIVVSQREYDASMGGAVIHRQRLLGMAYPGSKIGEEPDLRPFVDKWLRSNGGQCSFANRNESAALESALNKSVQSTPNNK